MALKAKEPVDRPPRADARRMAARILIIEAQFYPAIAAELVRGALEELEAAGATAERVSVPGALEIPHVLAAAAAAGLIPRGAPGACYDGAVALGCVMRGETSHYDIVCNNANHWLMKVAIDNCIPLGNGILTVDTEAQAMVRASGGRAGKGGDAAAACLRLIDLARQFVGQSA